MPILDSSFHLTATARYSGLQKREMTSFFSPLRYPGGKGRLGLWLSNLLKYNEISGGWYVEPYAGGAGAALFLLMKGHVGRVVINDADPVIHAFWKAAINDTDRLVNLILNQPVTMENWYQQKEILDNPNEYEPTEVGFAAFFLNRTNRSGILSGGVVGGKDQSGLYKLDARYNKSDLVARINKIGDMRQHINLYNLDALDLIDVIQPELPKKCLIYLDPPYYDKGSQLYRNYYQEGDHKLIAEKVKNLTLPWIVTYDNCFAIKELYDDSSMVEFSLYYSTHLERPKTTELMFYDNLRLHDIPKLHR